MSGVWGRSLRARIIVVNVLVVAALVVSAGVILQLALRASLLGSVDRELLRRTQPLVDSPPLDPSRPRGPPGVDATQRPRILDLDGRVQAPAGVEAPFDEDGWRRALRDGQHYSTISIEGQPVRVLSRSYRRGGELRGVVQAPYPLAEVVRSVNELGRIQLLMLPFALLLAGLVGVWLTHRVLRPTREITQAAQRIGVENLAERLEVSGGDEFARLASTFNEMLSRLEAAFTEQRRFTSDASHELQTPLAVIKANTSLALSSPSSREQLLEALREVESAADQISTLVRDLLLLARSESGGLPRSRQAIAVERLLVEAHARVAHSPGPSIETASVEAGLEVFGCEDELTRVVTNVLQNAKRYTPPEGKITLSATRVEGAVEIIVADTGCGVAPDDLARLGERFFRASPSRTRAEGGSGLGLAISRGITALHGGSIEFDSALGQGMRVKVLLPAPPSGEPSSLRSSVVTSSRRGPTGRG